MTMNSFPWDSLAVEMGEDGFPVYDRAWAADDLSEVFEPFFTNGVFMNVDESLAVTANNGFMLTVGFGKCHIDGKFGYIKNERELITVEPPDSQPRIDTVVIRRNLNLQARDFKPMVIKGTPAARPVRPNLTRTSTIYDLGICDIIVRPGSISISQSDVMDTRLDTSRCGMVLPFAELDTSTLMLRMEAALDAAVAKAEAQAGEELDRLGKQSDAAIEKINNELDRIIFISDKLTAGKPEGCACYEEMQAIKKLLYELLGVNDKFYVIGKTLYPPKGSLTIDGKQATLSGMTVTGKTAHFN